MRNLADLMKQAAGMQRKMEELQTALEAMEVTGESGAGLVRLSLNGRISCASCHVPAFGWSERRATTAGIEDTERNTRSIVNARFNRWFGWSGAADSLWAASLRRSIRFKPVSPSFGSVR